jgi:UDP-N-acetylmuramoylalanine--D-glutamate ligase
LAAAIQAGLPIWSDVELAWHLMYPDRVVPWLGVTGTNGKTTTTQMLTAILQADGHRVATVGNIGRPVIEAINDPEPYDVFAVELSSFQLHFAPKMSLHSAAVLNIHQDHLEWYAHQQPDPMSAYTADKARIYYQVTNSAVYNVAEPVTEHLVEEADVVEGARAIGFTLGIPGPSMVGVVDDLLVDRAFIEQRRDSALPLISIGDLPSQAPHNVATALAAAALARSFGVRATAVSNGLKGMRIGGHRAETVAEVNGVSYVDDSKATNPHAAQASLTPLDSVVWIAGGQTKETDFTKLITDNAAKMRAAVLLGIDRQAVADTFARVAPQVPIVLIERSDRGAMAEAVREAAKLAQAGDTVLMAPAAASRDIWTGYDQRGDDFQAAVHGLTKGESDEH